MGALKRDLSRLLSQQCRVSTGAMQGEKSKSPVNLGPGVAGDLQMIGT